MAGNEKNNFKDKKNNVKKDELQSFLLQSKDASNKGVYSVVETLKLPTCKPGIKNCGHANHSDSNLLCAALCARPFVDWLRSDKMKPFQTQLMQLKEGKHPVLMQHLQILNQRYQNRANMWSIWKENSINNAKLEYELEKKMIEEEYEAQKEELRESIISELEEKKKILENERTMMYVNGDFIDPRPMIMRKLRRRPNELPPPVPEKKKKNDTPGEIRFELDPKEAEHDVKLIQIAMREQLARRKAALNSGVTLSMPTTRSAAAAAAAAISGKSNAKVSAGSGKTAAGSGSKSNATISRNSHTRNASSKTSKVQSSSKANHKNSELKHDSKNTSKNSPNHHTNKAGDNSSHKEKFAAKVENGKLKYEKRWFLRGQPVYVEGKNLPRYSGIISSIKNSLIWVNRIDNSGSRLKVRLSQLIKGKVTIKRRAN